jgi:hypothetical protein
MADTLVNMHHHRIKYQWQAQRAEEFGVPSRAVRDSAPNIELGKSTAPPPEGFPSEYPLPAPPKTPSDDGITARSAAVSVESSHAPKPPEVAPVRSPPPRPLPPAKGTTGR